MTEPVEEINYGRQLARSILEQIGSKKISLGVAANAVMIVLCELSIIGKIEPSGFAQLMRGMEKRYGIEYAEEFPEQEEKKGD